MGQQARRSGSGARTGPLIHLRDRRLWLILVLALLAGTLAYQAPPTSVVAIGSPGDRLFLDGREGLGEADRFSFYGDEITDHARSGRSRWMRQDAVIVLPGLGAGGDLVLTLRAQGWPAGALNLRARELVVTVQANGAPIGQFTPTADWADQSFTIPSGVRAGGDLVLVLHASDVFTNTTTIADNRPKGIRLEALEVRAAADSALFALPAPLPLALLVLDGVLCLFALIVLTRRPTLAFVLTTILISIGAIGLALARVWMAALLPWASGALALLPLYARRRAIIGMGRRLLHRYARGSALNYGLAVMAAAWLAYIVARAAFTLKPPGLNAFRDSFPDSLLFGLLGMGLLLLILVRGRQGLPRLSHAIVRLFGGRRFAPALLLVLAATWLGYAAVVIAGMPYVGHADYADNAVVARNLIAGRGWVVDYVTQFYRLYSGITHPQETWPLLQPVWIAPFLLLFGAEPWAAKLPNLLFSAALTIMVYAAGTRLWDRRVGLSAAIIILTSWLFFRMIIYVTNDLAFVVFSFGAIYLLYRASEDRGWRMEDSHPEASEKRSSILDPRSLEERGLESKDNSLNAHQKRSSILDPPSSIRALLGSGLLTGLMLLQKPASGGLIALGMGLWLLGWAWRVGRGAAVPAHALEEARRRVLPARLAPLLRVAAWGIVALLILSPYLIRNIQIFRTPFYSTESYDAWVLEYSPVWDRIYGVYLRDYGLGDAPPDRSWLLRWGFDRTLIKLEHQADAVRDYLAPPWRGLPLGLSAHVTGREDKTRLLFDMGAWLALLGALGTWRARRRLASLLLAAFVPYTLFLIFYWHANEERYFVIVMPWLALLAGYALWRGYDRIAAIGDGRWTPVGLALAITALVLVVQPSWPDIADKVQNEPQLYAADLDAYTWLRNNTSPGDVMMTRNPWELNWTSQRPAVMIPYTSDPEVFLRLARYYHVRYLVLDSSQRPKKEVRDMLDQLLADPRLGFQEVYTTPVYQAPVGPMTTEIYRFPATYVE